jgi:hypothetical protein
LIYILLIPNKNGNPMEEEIDRDIDGVPKAKLSSRDSIILAIALVVFMIIAYIIFM